MVSWELLVAVYDSGIPQDLLLMTARNAAVSWLCWLAKTSEEQAQGSPLSAAVSICNDSWKTQMLFCALVFSRVIRFLWPHSTGLWPCLGMLLPQWDNHNSVTLFLERPEVLGQAGYAYRLGKELSGQYWCPRNPTQCCQATTLNRGNTTKYSGMKINLGYLKLLS